MNKKQLVVLLSAAAWMSSLRLRWEQAWYWISFSEVSRQFLSERFFTCGLDAKLINVTLPPSVRQNSDGSPRIPAGPR
jgi:hypothetical protein